MTWPAGQACEPGGGGTFDTEVDAKPNIQSAKMTPREADENSRIETSTSFYERETSGGRIGGILVNRLKPKHAPGMETMRSSFPKINV
jgi:hypothetical protein